MSRTDVNRDTSKTVWCMPAFMLFPCLFVAAVTGKSEDAAPMDKQPVYVVTYPERATDGVGQRPAIKLVNPTLIDRSLSIDTAGLRIYTDSAATLTRMQSRFQDPEIQASELHHLQGLIAAALKATGVEPETVPIKNPIAKTCGTDGMIQIKAGEFERSGDYLTSTGTDLNPRRGPAYRVHVAAFYMDQYKVTNAAYCRFLNAGNGGYWNAAGGTPAIHHGKSGTFEVVPGHEKRPVTGVNWYQATGFAKWMGRRLPTEAEWEMAARGTEGRSYPWGEESPDPTRGHFESAPLVDIDAHPDGATPDGIFGLTGNGPEWCGDYFGTRLYETVPPERLLKNPTGPRNGNADWDHARLLKGFVPETDSLELLQKTRRHARSPVLVSAVSFRTVKGCG